MKRDFKTWMILVAFAIPLVPLLFILTIYFSNCGVNVNCARGDLAGVIHTPIPTLLPATLPAPTLEMPATVQPTVFHFGYTHTFRSGGSPRAIQRRSSWFSHQPDWRSEIRDGAIRKQLFQLPWSGRQRRSTQPRFLRRNRAAAEPDRSAAERSEPQGFCRQYRSIHPNTVGTGRDLPIPHHARLG